MDSTNHAFVVMSPTLLPLFKALHVFVYVLSALQYYHSDNDLCQRLILP